MDGGGVADHAVIRKKECWRYLKAIVVKRAEYNTDNMMFRLKEIFSKD